MSLLTTASPWINDDSTITKKRPSTMRKSLNKTANAQSVSPSSQETNHLDMNEIYNDLHIEHQGQSESFQSISPTTIEQSQTINEKRNSTINELLNKMTSASDESGKMANFNPPPQPILNNRKPYNTTARDSKNELLPADLLPNPVIKPMSLNSNQGNLTSDDFNQKIGYVSNDNNLGKLSNYKNIYEPSNIQLKPYYAQMGIGHLSGSTDNKLMEKINYMIHLLEEQQNEKTNSVTEEFILYSFLGIFIIFVVDSFARAGKYSR